MQLTAGMLGFGTALAFPFGFLSFFPNILSKLPKSGGWLHNVKVSLGFIELALALKFLSNADMVQSWGLMPRELFIGIWMLLLLLWAVFLLGGLSFLHAKPKKSGNAPKSIGCWRVGICGLFGTRNLTESKHAITCLKRFSTANLLFGLSNRFGLPLRIGLL